MELQGEGASLRPPEDWGGPVGRSDSGAGPLAGPSGRAVRGNGACFLAQLIGGDWGSAKGALCISRPGTPNHDHEKGTRSLQWQLAQVVVGGLGEAEGRTHWGLCLLPTPRPEVPVLLPSSTRAKAAEHPEAPLSTHCPSAGRHRHLDRHPGVHRPSRAAHLPCCPGDRTEPTGRGRPDSHACA